MQNVLKPKNMYFDEKICKICSHGPVLSFRLSGIFWYAYRKIIYIFLRTWFYKVKEDEVYQKFGHLKISDKFFFGQIDRPTDRHCGS